MFSKRTSKIFFPYFLNLLVLWGRDVGHRDLKKEIDRHSSHINIYRFKTVFKCAKTFRTIKKFSERTKGIRAVFATNQNHFKVCSWSS